MDSLQEKPREITWLELKEFTNSVPEEYLSERVSVIYEDEGYANSMNEPFFIENDIYCHKEDPEDSSSMEELKKAHEFDDEPFNEENYVLITKKGTPFLWMDGVWKR